MQFGDECQKSSKLILNESHDLGTMELSLRAAAYPCAASLNLGVSPSSVGRDLCGETVDKRVARNR